MGRTSYVKSEGDLPGAVEAIAAQHEPILSSTCLPVGCFAVSVRWAVEPRIDATKRPTPSATRHAGRLANPKGTALSSVFMRFRYRRDRSPNELLDQLL